MSEPSTCRAVEMVAPDLALGLLAGAERSATLAHLERCERCRTHVDELSRAVDALLELAPGSEPPEGFECRVLDTIAGVAMTAPRAPEHLRRRVRRGARIAAAMVAAAVVTALAMVAIGSSGDGGSSGLPIEEATMRTPSGRDVGEVYVSGTDPSWVLVSVPNWRAWEDDEDEASDGTGPGRSSRKDGTGYRLRLELVNGDEEVLDIPSLVTGDGSWGSNVDVDGDDVVTVAVIGQGGRVWCEATLAGS